jgi:hypothetical protein
VRTLYLMRLFPDKKMASAFSVLADRLCGLAALVLFMAATLAWNHQTFLAGELGRGIVLSAASLLGGAILLLGLWWMTTIPSLRDFVKRRHPRFSPHLLESGAIFQQMAQRPSAMLSGCALAVAALAAHFLGYFFSAKAFGSSLGVERLFSIMPIVDTLTMLPVALYGLGLREVVLGDVEDRVGGGQGLGPAVDGDLDREVPLAQLRDEVVEALDRGALAGLGADIARLHAWLRAAHAGAARRGKEGGSSASSPYAWGKGEGGGVRRCR